MEQDQIKLFSVLNVSMGVYFTKSYNDLTSKQGQVIWWPFKTDRRILADALCSAWVRTECVPLMIGVDGVLREWRASPPPCCNVSPLSSNSAAFNSSLVFWYKATWVSSCLLASIDWIWKTPPTNHWEDTALIEGNCFWPAFLFYYISFCHRMTSFSIKTRLMMY